MLLSEVVKTKRAFRFTWEAKDDLNTHSPYLKFKNGGFYIIGTDRFYEVTSEMFIGDTWDALAAELELSRKQVAEAVTKACLLLDVAHLVDVFEKHVCLSLGFDLEEEFNDV